MTTGKCRDWDEIFLHLQYPWPQKVLSNSAKVSVCFTTLPLKPVPLLLLPDPRYDRLEHCGRASIPGHHSGEGEMGILFGFSCCYDSEALKISWYYSSFLACLLQQWAAGYSDGEGWESRKCEWSNPAPLYCADKCILLWTLSVISQPCSRAGAGCWSQGGMLLWLRDRGEADWPQNFIALPNTAAPWPSLLPCVHGYAPSRVCISLCVSGRQHFCCGSSRGKLFLQMKVLLKYMQVSNVGEGTPGRRDMDSSGHFYALPPNLNSSRVCVLIFPSLGKYTLPQSPVRSVLAPVPDAVGP